MPVIVLSAFIGGGAALVALSPYGWLIALAGAWVGASVTVLITAVLLAESRSRCCKGI